MNKLCAKCGKEKLATPAYFHRHKGRKDGLNGYCKECVKELNQANGERIKAKSKEWRETHKEESAAAIKRWREENREHVLEYGKQYRQKNKEQRATGFKAWSVANRPTRREYHRKRYQANNSVKVNISISTGIGKSLKGNKNGRSWESLVGFTLEELMSHLESQFTKGMTWGNYGYYGWHIDHIRPVSSFNFTSAEDPEFKECWSLWNLQPMWGKENRSKNSRCLAPPLPLLTKQQDTRSVCEGTQR